LSGGASQPVGCCRADEFRTLLEQGEETGMLDAAERVLLDKPLET
jgi:hypothetical protein